MPKLPDRICALEIWVELLNGDVKKLTRAMAIEINDVLRKTEGWYQPRNKIRFSTYGLQKGFYKRNKIVNRIGINI